MITRPSKEKIEKITKGLADQGLLIEAGWVGFRLGVISEEASATQVDEQRKTFFAGALHLFSSIINMLDPGEDETPADLRRMELISVELAKFGETLGIDVQRGRRSPFDAPR